MYLCRGTSGYQSAKLAKFAHTQKFPTVLSLHVQCTYADSCLYITSHVSNYVLV